MQNAPVRVEGRPVDSMLLGKINLRLEKAYANGILNRCALLALLEEPGRDASFRGLADLVRDASSAISEAETVDGIVRVLRRVEELQWPSE